MASEEEDKLPSDLNDFQAWSYAQYTYIGTNVWYIHSVENSSRARPDKS